MDLERERIYSNGSHGGGRRITEVQIDGAALLRIVKHCEDSLPAQSTGALLGLDVSRGEGQGTVMQISYAFALPRGRDGGYNDGQDDDHEDERADQAKHEYKRHMMKLLKEVNVDNNMIGWYRTMQLGHFSEAGLKTDTGGMRSQRTLFDVPSALVDDMSENSIVLLYDPVQTAMGSLTIKAFRHLRTPSSREEAEMVASFKDLLEEIPVTIRNPGIVSALLFDLQYDAKSKADFSKLDLSSNPYLSRNLELLSDEVDRMSIQLERYKRFHAGGGRPPRDQRGWPRRREEEEDRNAEPNRIDTVLSATQIDAYCSQISTFSKASCGKLALVGSLHKEGGLPTSSSSTSE